MEKGLYDRKSFDFNHINVESAVVENLEAKESITQNVVLDIQGQYLVKEE